MNAFTHRTVTAGSFFLLFAPNIYPGSPPFFFVATPCHCQRTDDDQRTRKMRLKELESHLSTLDCAFPSPNIALEQYPTSAHIASRILFTAHSTYDDIEGRTVLDLGCGTGILSVGAGLLDPDTVVGLDCDESAIAIAKRNAEEEEVPADFVLCRVPQIPINSKFDTVVMNPPFGTRSAGADWTFLETGLKNANVVYSLHKSSTRSYLLEKAKRDFKCSAEVVAELKFDIPKAYKFHKKESLDVMVDLLRFENPAE